MSLSYKLRINTDFQPQEILQFLSNKLQLEWEENIRLFGRGIVLGANTESEENQEIIFNAFGFIPTVGVWFRLNPNKNYEEGIHTLLLSTLLLLNKIPGDAVLLFNYDSVVLQKINHTLIFNQELATWSKSILDNEVKQQFYWEPLPSPLLSDEPPKIELKSAIHTRLKATSLRQGKSMTQLANEAIEAFLNRV